MTTNEPHYLNYVYPLLHENESEDFPYSMVGTCFICKYEEDYFVLTSAHNLETWQLEEKNLFIPISNNYTISFALKDSFKINEPNKEKSDRTDVCFIGINKLEHPTEEISHLSVIDISLESLKNSFSEVFLKDAWTKGFPDGNDKHYVDYLEKKIRVQGYITNGLIKSRKHNSKNCSYISLKSPLPHGMKEARGMSGAPIFAIDQNDKVLFSGIIRGFNEYTLEYQIIDANFIKSVLEQIILNEKNKIFKDIDLSFNLKIN